MAYGFNIYRANGTLLCGSSSFGGVLVETFLADRGQGVITKPYPAFAGNTLRVTGGNGGGYASASPSIGYSNGYPTLTIDTNQAGLTGQFYVWAV